MRLFAVTVLVLAAGCQSIPADAPKASASLQPTKGSSVRGTATFVQIDGKVRVTANVSGLKPDSQFGFHIHEAGDCNSGDGMSAKGHFNPLAKPHGHHTTMERHAGDMPNLQSDASGNASLTADLDVITITPGTTGIVGRGLIVHAQPDDYKSQPVGNAGARSACAVIQRG
ncbi:MAG: superoxide dismutase family protein [Betaproteobacteria bacterium]|nr:superoxide dismutase family protein [Betaproteobacteria bacterium]